MRIQSFPPSVPSHQIFSSDSIRENSTPPPPFITTNSKITVYTTSKVLIGTLTLPLIPLEKAPLKTSALPTPSDQTNQPLLTHANTSSLFFRPSFALSLPAVTTSEKIAAASPPSLKLADFKYIIPVGDHCGIADILKEKGIRTFSYPFDWCTSHSLLYGTNLNEITAMLTRKLKYNQDCGQLMKEMLGNAMDNDKKLNLNNGLWFPHDKGTTSEIHEKYTRRFTRLIQHVTSGSKCLYMFVNRHADISASKINELTDLLTAYNPESKLILFLGKKFKNTHKNVIYQYIPYDVKQFDYYDQTYFRPEIGKYLQTLL